MDVIMQIRFPVFHIAEQEKMFFHFSFITRKSNFHYLHRRDALMETFRMENYFDTHLKDIGFSFKIKNPLSQYYDIHNHDFFEYFFLTSGSTGHIINGKKEILTRGNLVFIRPDDCHGFYKLEGQEFEIINITISQSEASGALSRLPAQRVHGHQPANAASAADGQQPAKPFGCAQFFVFLFPESGKQCAFAAADAVSAYACLRAVFIFRT